jgi:hypothetical protein
MSVLRAVRMPDRGDHDRSIRAAPRLWVRLRFSLLSTQVVCRVRLVPDIRRETERMMQVVSRKQRQRIMNMELPDAPRTATLLFHDRSFSRDSFCRAPECRLSDRLLLRK